MLQRLKSALSHYKEPLAIHDDSARIELRAFRVNNDHNMHMIFSAGDGQVSSTLLAKGLSERQAEHAIEKASKALAQIFTAESRG